MRAASVLALCLAATSLVAREIPLGFPLECVLGETCFIQNYPDADGGPGAADFTCGPQSFDGHKGTDIALTSLAAQRAGIRVLSAAPGRVTAIRDGEADVLKTTAQAADPTGRECGNGVVIDHGGGWETQYCHMKRGSINVQPGQRVAMGAPLGLVGLSGRTQFPHLHISVRRDGVPVDPFAPGNIATCLDLNQGDGATQMWLDPISYAPGGLITIGFHDALPDFAQIKSGDLDQTEIDASAAALVLWGYIFAGRAGDVISLTISGPDGPFFETRLTLEKTQAQLFRAGGRRLHDGNRRPGLYTGTVVLTRAGQVIDRMETQVFLR
ncbi:MAG TPA: M23 family metallopeptidase [Aliiroseovarius sp.]|nr:M23 family metallopeptidase [Aliiroseovarius sp.]